MCYRMSEISRHPVVAATRALRFADHVTKRNEGSGNENEHKYKYLVATAQAYLHFAHVYLHSVIQDGGPRRRGRIPRNWDFASLIFHNDETEKQGKHQHQKREMYVLAKIIL